MRVVQVCPLYYPYVGGVETHVKEISERLAMRFDVEVLSTDPSGTLSREEMIDGVKVIRFKSWTPDQSYYFSRGLRSYLSNLPDTPDILHAHSYRDLPALYCTRAGKARKFVFTPHYHGAGTTFLRNLLYKPYRLLGKKIFQKADHVICVSNFEKTLVMNHFKINEQKISVIPNGIELKEFEALKKKKHDGRLILYVGRLEKYKGLQYAIETLPRLDRDIILEVVGEGPYKNSLLRLAERLGVRNRVFFYQVLPRKELLQKYVDADLFVLLSKQESYGICVAEALSSRTPCIVANESALKEWVDEKNCFGVNYPINASQLAKLIEKVIGKRVDNIDIPTWHDVAESLARLYMSDTIDSDLHGKNSMMNNMTSSNHETSE